MTRDEVIRLAREASGGTDWWPLYNDTLERFAALVAAHEREDCIADIYDCTSSDDSRDYYNGVMTAVAAIRAREE